MTPTEAYDELIRRGRETSLLGSCGAVLGWDERTYLPPKGAEHRGNQMALLARMTHEMATDPVIGELLEVAQNHANTAQPESDESVNLREIRRSYDRAVKLPKRLVEELARAAIVGQQAWDQARKQNDFAIFEPHLSTIVRLKREEAEAVGFEEHPYDALLDEYEPGARASQLRPVFRQLADELVPLISAITNSSVKPDSSLLQRDYSVTAQEAFGREAATAIGFDFDAGRLDVTSHPFCTGIGPGDTRLTTRYNPNAFNEAFFGTLHEAGHGIYEQNLPAEHYGTPLGEFVSLGIHESQSRLWENQVGRSAPFWEYFFPKLRDAFPSIADVDHDAFLLAVNQVSPSFIRVEADEATYNLHIALRFEIEQDLLTGALSVADLPGAWDERFRALFDLTPPNAAQGCLQDIHWSMGGIGYFPTYTLGNLYAAQFMARAKQDLSGLDDDFRRGEFGRLKDWLTENIHRHGRRYRAGELCERVTSKPLSHRPLIEYLREKYAALYSL